MHMAGCTCGDPLQLMMTIHHASPPFVSKDPLEDYRTHMLLLLLSVRTKKV